MDKATLSVTLDFGGYRNSLTAAVEIAGPYVEVFDPLDLCDEPLITMLGSNHVTHATYQRKLRLREGFAKDLAGRLAAHLVGMMSSRDTHNGYPIEKNEDDLSPRHPAIPRAGEIL
jgi:hypothetical protein